MSTPSFTANTEAQAANPPPATPQRILLSRTPAAKSEPAFPPTPQLDISQHRQVFDSRATAGKVDFATLQLLLQDIYNIKDETTLREQAEAIFCLVGNVDTKTGSLDYTQFATSVSAKQNRQYNRQQDFDADVQFTHDINRKKIRNDELKDGDEEVELKA